ncbi:MAG TPA: glycosyltransferase domain-containing protein [Vicinamibacterales bacterium]|nr:glycosyltransferase domain-containing protein [Vicinamibacterales bacterium]
MTVIVFTCVLGDTDPLRACRKVPGVRYICFADRYLNVPPYDILPYEAGELGPQLASRQLKILANHPALLEADVTLWHDAAYQLSCNPETLAQSYLKTADVVAMRHPHRDRIEDEAAVIARLGYMPLDTLTRQVAHYRAEGFLAQQAITSTGFCLRRRTPAVEAWQAAWWAEVARWGYRDQMSVDYALWRTGLTIEYIPGHYKDNPHARWFNTDAAREAARRLQAARPPIRRPLIAAVPRRSRYG